MLRKASMITTLALVGLFMFGVGDSLAEVPLKKEAESNVSNSSTTALNDANATPSSARPNALRFDSATSVRYDFVVSDGDHIDNIAVRARAGNANTQAVDISIVVDGQAQGVRQIGKATTTYGEKNWAVDLSPGSHTVSVRMSNSPSPNKLVVDWVELRGTSKPPILPDCRDLGFPTLQSQIDSTPSGGTLTITGEPCIFREQVNITKPLTLVDEAGSEIRGSKIWKDWTRQVNGTYISKDDLDEFLQEDTSCIEGSYRCSNPEQVFRNGAALTQIPDGSTPTDESQFALNADRKVVIDFNPSSSNVEISENRHWITSNKAVNDVTIRGWTMKHAATDWRCGGIQSRPPSNPNGSTLEPEESCRDFRPEGSGWKIIDNNLESSAGANISVRGLNTEILNNKVSLGGQLGIHNTGNGSRLVGNRVFKNNTEEFCKGTSQECEARNADGNATLDKVLVESGGIKLAERANIQVTDNYIYENYGHGLWFDTGSGPDIEILKNRVYSNERNGIWFEISEDGNIANNIVYDNGSRDNESPDSDAGISIGNSDQAQVSSNLLIQNENGIDVVCNLRGKAAGSTDPDLICKETVVFENDVIQNVGPEKAIVWRGNSPWSETDTSRLGSLYQKANGNEGKNNKVSYSDGEGANARFQWRSFYKKLGVEDSNGFDSTEFNSTYGGSGLNLDKQAATIYMSNERRSCLIREMQSRVEETNAEVIRTACLAYPE